MTYYGPTSEDYDDHEKAREAFRRVDALEKKVAMQAEDIRELAELSTELAGHVTTLATALNQMFPQP